MGDVDGCKKVVLLTACYKCRSPVLHSEKRRGDPLPPPLEEKRVETQILQLGKKIHDMMRIIQSLLQLPVEHLLRSIF